MAQVIQTLKRGTTPQQLVCFPFLGGYAGSYYPLASVLSDAIEIVAINPPGHGPCQKMPLRSMKEMVDLYFDSLQSIVRQPCIFFGHSMGAIVAFFLAHRIMDSPEYRVKPAAIIVSAVNSPDFFARSQMTSRSDEEILEYLISIGGIHEELRRETELLNYLAPTFRADFTALESVVLPQPLPQLDLPARLLFGSADRSVTVESIQTWQEYFSQGTSEIRVDGGHMFVTQNPVDVARHIEDLFAELS
jgi:external thioesterase TEII